jgi:hypothetical protein
MTFGRLWICGEAIYPWFLPPWAFCQTGPLDPQSTVGLLWCSCGATAVSQSVQQESLRLQPPPSSPTAPAYCILHHETTARRAVYPVPPPGQPLSLSVQPRAPSPRAAQQPRLRARAGALGLAVCRGVLWVQRQF